MNKKLLFLFAALLLLGVAETAVILWRLDNPEYNNSSQIASDGNSNSPSVFDKSKYSINEAASLWIVVNKGRKLPSNYAPANLTVPGVKLHYSRTANDSKLRADAAIALEQMLNSASTAGLRLILYSGYRSYSQQAAVNSNFVRTQGQQETDKFSARAGHSEHQTGLAADVSAASGKCNLDQCFGDMPEGKWIEANAHAFGFIIRYPKDKLQLTGYEYEPWHLRYVGTELAAEIQKTGQTLEQFFNLPIYVDYPSSIFQLGT